jgi:ribosome recycling factor
MDALKKAEKDNEMTEDEHKRHADEVQKTTDGFIKRIDDMLTAKEADVMKI